MEFAGSTDGGCSQHQRFQVAISMCQGQPDGLLHGLSAKP